LIRAITLANPGEEQLVPSIGVVTSWIMTAYGLPWNATSGKPRPLALNIPGKSLGRAARYAATDADWYVGMGKTLEKPPLEKDSAVSGAKFTVAPTEVTKGQDAGKTGINVSLVHCRGTSWPLRTPP
jgi:hypothetical protein